MRVLFTGGFDTTMMALCAAQGPMVFAYCWLAVGLLGLSYLFPRDCNIKGTWAKTAFSTVCILAIIFLGQPTNGEFIYFQF